jgi:hypothetical protein
MLKSYEVCDDRFANRHFRIRRLPHTTQTGALVLATMRSVETTPDNSPSQLDAPISTEEMMQLRNFENLLIESQIVRTEDAMKFLSGKFQVRYFVYHVDSEKVHWIVLYPAGY